MAEPEDLTLRLLREIRSQGEALAVRMDRLEHRMDKLEARMDKLEGRMDKLEGRMDNIESRMERGFAEVRERFVRVEGSLQSFNQILTNELIHGRYVTAAVDQRFTEIERRLTALEQRP